jgi:uncharacterized damage-inducible protein DinB
MPDVPRIRENTQRVGDPQALARASEGLPMATLQELTRLIDDCRMRLRLVLEGLTEEDLNFRPAPGMNSIGNIVRHIGGGSRMMVGEWIGGIEQVRNREEEFSAPHTTLAEVQEILAHEEKVWREVMATMTDEGLRRVISVPQRQFHGPVESMLINLYRHFNYHTGQIMVYRRMRGHPAPHMPRWY